MVHSRGIVLASLLLVALIGGWIGTWLQQAEAQGAASHYFAETKHMVAGAFWSYWQEHGGLPQQGYPISEEFTEVSDLDGKAYTVQYFERAVFEKHPENKPPFDVLLSQLGAFQYKARYGVEGATSQQPNSTNARLFRETGYIVGGVFLDYWTKHGGLPQQGYPISNEFNEVSVQDGKAYTVQYFERAVFEYHPENKPPYDVLLSQLGAFQISKKYPGGGPAGEGQPQPTSVPVQPTASHPSDQATKTSGTNCKPVEDSRKSIVSHTGPVAISNVQYQATEFVELTNSSGAAVDLGDWKLRDKNDEGQVFVFPAGTPLEVGGKIQVYTNPGHPFCFNSKGPIWNNCGDALELLDKNGAVVATYAYGTHVR